MTEQFAIDIGRQAIYTILLVLSPLLGAGLIVGIFVGILQAVTQVHEMTLTFVPKILAIVIVLILLLPWMLTTLLDYTRNILTHLP